MRLRAIVLIVIACGGSGTVSRVAAQQRPRCGTIEGVLSSHQRRLSALSTTSREVQATPQPTIIDGIITLAANSEIAPGGKPLDLQGRALLFQRLNPTTYTVTSSAADLNTDFGVDLTMSADYSSYATYTLPFQMPFFDTSISTVYITRYNAIQFSVPSYKPDVRQLSALDALDQPNGMIAPLLTTPYGLYFVPKVSVKPTADAVTVTWRMDLGGFSYRVATTLSRDGSIRFAYYDLSQPPYGSAVVITSGSEAWRQHPPSTLESDFANASGQPLGGPIVETFTLPTLDEHAIWTDLKSYYNLSDSDYDAVAIYTNFDTDVVTFATAYAWPGNPGVDNIGRAQSSTAVPRFPTLMNMNNVHQSSAITTCCPTRYDTAILMHELGHRWLFSVSYKQNGTTFTDMTGVGSREGGHPSRWLDTRAAFPVHDAHDYSVMGGDYLIDRGDGTFQNDGFQNHSQAYSWIDLYLMGLASPDEVPPTFYVADAVFSSPYVHGTRRDVTMADIAAAMQLRNPSFASSQRTFSIAFVLVSDAQHTVSASELSTVHEIRQAFVVDFATASNYRGSINTEPLDHRRRHTARH